MLPTYYGNKVLSASNVISDALKRHFSITFYLVNQGTCGYLKYLTEFTIKVKPLCNQQIKKGLNGTPGAIRTRDLRLRRPMLYPAELQVHFMPGCERTWLFA